MGVCVCMHVCVFVQAHIYDNDNDNDNDPKYFIQQLKFCFLHYLALSFLTSQCKNFSYFHP